jgi:hypothetical protein
VQPTMSTSVDLQEQAHHDCRRMWEVAVCGGRIFQWQMGHAADKVSSGVLGLQGTFQGGGALQAPMLGRDAVQVNHLAAPVFGSIDGLHASFEQAPTGMKLHIYFNLFVVNIVVVNCLYQIS